MKKLLFICVLLLGTMAHSQYQAPVKLRTITIKDSYKGSSIRAYKVMRVYKARDKYYVPMEVMPAYERLDHTEVYCSTPPLSRERVDYKWVTCEDGITRKVYY